MSKNLLKNRQLTTDDFALSFQTVEMSEEVQGAVTLKLRCIYYKRPKKNFKTAKYRILLHKVKGQTTQNELQSSITVTFATKNAL